MHCPFCKCEDTKVLDTRLLSEGKSTRRRRECLKCLKRFTTYEEYKFDFPVVVKKDGRREAFDREKLFRGIEKATQKLPVSASQLENIISNVEKQLREFSSNEVPSDFIGKVAMSHLKVLNPVAYVRFASVYKQFHSIDEFYRDLKNQKDLSENNFQQPKQLNN